MRAGAGLSHVWHHAANTHHAADGCRSWNRSPFGIDREVDYQPIGNQCMPQLMRSAETLAWDIVRHHGACGLRCPTAVQRAGHDLPPAHDVVARMDHVTRALLHD